MNRIKGILFVIMVGFAFSFITSYGYAEGQDDKTLSPYFFVEGEDISMDSFFLKETDVRVNITGVIADVVVTQRYVNEGRQPINARYIFPASTRAAVHGMKMKIGEQVIVAKIEERQEAQRKYNKAKKAGKSASLLKQQRPNVFSMNVANIIPDDVIDIELCYTELLVPSNNIYEFVYPTVVGPRYSNQPELGAPETDQWIKNPYLKQDAPSRTAFNITTAISTGMGLQEVICKSHEINTLWKTDSMAEIFLAKSEDFGGNRDYVLNYRLAGDKIESGLLLYEGKDENYFLVMVQPPRRVKLSDIPPREYIFVVDISGSMHGFPLDTSKRLLSHLIKNLRPTDKFNVVLFAGGSCVMAPISVTATEENLNKAIRLINHQRGGGGTELYSALEKAIALTRDEAFSRSIVVVTDGYIGAERAVFDLIQKNLNRANVFAFGIGSSVNRFLIEGMAKAGLGESFIVTQPKYAMGMAARFREYIQSPVLTHITVEYNAFEAYDMEPVGVPDMFAERPVILFGKYRNKAHGRIEVRGISGGGEYVQSFDVSKRGSLGDNRALRYLWARKRIARLSDFNFGQRDDEHKAEITNLGLTYNLLTAHTSFVAVQKVIRNPEGNAKDVDQPLPLPLHVTNLAVGGSISSVPEPELYLMLLLLFLVFLGRWQAKSLKKKK